MLSEETAERLIESAEQIIALKDRGGPGDPEGRCSKRVAFSTLEADVETARNELEEAGDE